MDKARDIAILAWLMVAAALVPLRASADAGYFQIGHGAESRGVGGAGIAATRDAFGGANNPATTVWVGSRIDGALLLTGGRSEQVREAGLPPPLTGLLDSRSEDSESFELIGELAYSRQLRSDLAASFVIYGNGAGAFLPGSTTACPTPPGAPVPVFTGNALCGSGRVGSVLKQLTVAPTVAYRLNAAASVGASLLLTGQSYKAEGLQAFASQSTNPAALTNQGEDYSYGVGLRIGGYWRVSPMLSLGTSWSPKVRMSKLDKYAGLLPDGGRLDVPESFVAGLQFSPSERVSILLDYKRINYADSSAFGNQPFNGTVPRGAAGGPGLAWKNMDVFKAGVRAEVTNQFRLSVGGSLNSEAFDEKDVSSNILTPATFRKHVTVALAYVQSAASEWSIFYNRSNGDRLTGPSAVSSAFATQVLGQPTSVGTETIEVRSQTAGIQFSRRL